MKLAEIAKKVLLKEYDTASLQKKYPNMRPERMGKIVNFLKKRKLENGIFFAPLGDEEELFALVLNDKNVKIWQSGEKEENIIPSYKGRTTYDIEIKGVVSVPFQKRPDSEKQWMYHGDSLIFAVSADIVKNFGEITMHIRQVKDMFPIPGIKGEVKIYPLNRKEEGRFAKELVKVFKNKKWKYDDDKPVDSNMIITVEPNIFSKSQM